MPNGSGRTNGTRRLAWLVVAFSCAALAADPATNPPGERTGASLGRLCAAAAPPAKPPVKSKPAKQRPTRGKKATTKPAATSQPTSTETTRPVGPETYAQTRQRLMRIAADRRTPEQIAMLTGLDFALALSQANGARAVAVVDATGYVTLPLIGPLPERPAKGLYPEVLEPQLSVRRPIKIDDLPSETLQVTTAEKLKDRAPAVATWMLTTNDRAVVFLPPEPRVPGWVQHEAYLVVRVRADHGTVVAGTLLASLNSASPAPDGEEK